MKGARGGYTIVEVIIVLAVSVLIFFAAITVFLGKQGKTEFAQAMRDVESQIQSVVNDVRVSTFPYADNYTCDVANDPADPAVGPRAKLDEVTGGLGTNTKCIFLGKAILLQKDTDPHQLKVYTVLGRRTANGSPVTTFDQANPEAIDKYDQLIDIHKVTFGATIKSATSLQSTPPIIASEKDAYLMGFYNSLLPTITSSETNQSLKVLGYAGVTTDNQVKNAVRGKTAGGIEIEDSKRWTICFESGTSSETAQVIVNASFSGVTTQINYTSC